MATYHFVSDSQLMFTVMLLDGRKVVVNFNERGSNGVSSFLTSNDKVAQAIMGHSFFRKGRVVLSNTAESKKEEKEVVLFPVEKLEADAKAEEPDETDGTVGEAPQTPAEPDEDDSNLNFENITLAKEYLHRRFGIAKTEIRSISKTIAYAESKGLKITIGEE